MLDSGMVRVAVKTPVLKLKATNSYRKSHVTDHLSAKNMRCVLWYSLEDWVALQLIVKSVVVPFAKASSLTPLMRRELESQLRE